MRETIKNILAGVAGAALSCALGYVFPGEAGTALAILGSFGSLLGGGGSGMVQIPEPPKTPVPLTLNPISVLPTTGVQPIATPLTSATPGTVKNYGALRLVTPAGEQLAAPAKTKTRSAAYTAKKTAAFEKKTGQKAGFQYGVTPEAVAQAAILPTILPFGGIGDYYKGAGAVQQYAATPAVQDFLTQLLGIAQAPRNVGPTTGSYQQARERFLSRIFV